MSSTTTSRARLKALPRHQRQYAQGYLDQESVATAQRDTELPQRGPHIVSLSLGGWTTMLQLFAGAAPRDV